MADDTSQQPPDKLLYHWIKSHLFRVVHADGAWGGIAPRGAIHFALFNERQAIPRLSYRPIRVSGGAIQAGPEEMLEAREGIVREIEVEVIMDYNTAVEFRDWLSAKISQMKETTSELGMQQNGKEQ